MTGESSESANSSVGAKGTPRAISRRGRGGVGIVDSKASRVFRALNGPLALGGIAALPAFTKLSAIRFACSSTL